MKAKAITYYYNMLAKYPYSGFKFHRTGAAAVATIQQDCKQLFDLPYIKKNSMNLTRKNSVTIGYPSRKLIARFLTDEEIALYERYGKDVAFDMDRRRLVAPEKESEQKMKYKALNLVASLAWGGNGFYEVAPISLDGEHLPHKKLQFSLCREKKLIRRYDHTRKLREYLNTEEGNAWFDEVSKDFGY